jgi:alpha-glucosidase
MPAGWDRLAVDAQLASAGSMLGFYRSVLAFRRTLGGVLDADMRWSPAPAGVLAYQRGRLKVAVNFVARPVEIAARGSLLIASQPRVLLKSGKLILPANSGAWIDTEGGR